jgi:NAD(P)-dependent dehydrogenase (short-subunit alcohol dehydrogenase family)
VLDHLDGKTALVTGAAKRIGRAIALGLAAKGADIVFNYRASAAEAETTQRDIEAHGVRVLALQADLTEMDGCDFLVETALREFGHVDILVNNASNFPRTPISELAADRSRFEKLFEQLVAIHMRAPLYLGLRLGLQMKQNGWGRIVNLTDRVTARSQAYSNWVLYLVTKYGLFGISQTLAEELRPEVTVNSVAPGLVVPPPEFGAEATERLREKVPLGRQVAPEEIAADVLHLVMSDSKTGAVILTDGGAGTHTY